MTIGAESYWEIWGNEVQGLFIRLKPNPSFHGFADKGGLPVFTALRKNRTFYGVLVPLL